MPNMQTFEEFYASVTGGKSPVGDLRYQAMRAASDPQLAMSTTDIEQTFRLVRLGPEAEVKIESLRMQVELV
jgi:hypothetical protein